MDTLLKMAMEQLHLYGEHAGMACDDALRDMWAGGPKLTQEWEDLYDVIHQIVW